MKLIVTITLNPAVDGASEADEVRPIRKVRTTNERYDPGGGGINVARVLAELGRPALPVYLAGGATGAVLDDLLAARGLAGRRISIGGHTRISHAVFERSSGLEYRFVPEGPRIAEEESRRLLAAVEDLDFDYCVASGSLPRGVPDDFYVALARVVARKGGRLVLDTSGAELKAAVTAGGLYLVKPSLGEFEGLIGRSLREAAAQEAAARELVGGGGRRDARRQPRPRGRSAGDSRRSAAVLTPGTELCRLDDVWRLYEALGGRRAEPAARPGR
jgi:6-phosphofructokinase 2